jgi:hypothetical protein
VPEASVSHNVGDGRGRLAYFARRCYFEGGSKAVVSRLVGPADGLATEARYTCRVLPRGVVRGVQDFALGRDAAGLARAGAILIGLAVTTVGYVLGHLRAERAARSRGWSGGRLPARDDPKEPLRNSYLTPA